MGRSICKIEPSQAIAGQQANWKFTFTTATTLPKGTKIKFDLQSKGRPIDWEAPSANPKAKGGIIYGLLGKNKIVPAKEIPVADSFAPDYEFVLPSPLEANQSFVIIMGAKPGETAKKQGGIQAQTVSQRRKAFLLYVDPSGKGRYGEPEAFTIDVRGGPLANIRILTPSFVTRNKRFDAIVRFEDEFGNLTNQAPPDTLITLSHENQRENLNWKLFVPETGFISLPNLYFNEPGIYTLKLNNAKTKEVFGSAPIYCLPEGEHKLFWGLLHGESDRYDSTENIENCFRHFRDDKAFNFYATSSFENVEETPNEVWKSISQNVIDFNEDERFTGFLGFQWAGDAGNEGVRQIIYTKDNKPILRKKEAKNNTLSKIYKSHSPKDIISIPTFTMGKGAEFNFDDFNPDFERVVEIYNAWGSSEQTKKEGNPIPISSTSPSGYKESADGSIQKALLNNHRFGFVAGGLDDRGIYADLYDSDQEQYPSGLTAIIAGAHTREALAEALYQRSCYATTGERMIVTFSLAGIQMGRETSTAEKRGLAINRHIAGVVAGTSQLVKVEIIRNGKVLKAFEPKGYSFEFAYDDMTPLEKVVLKSKDKKPPFVYYYLRVTQEDGHMAWSSPIWVDYIPLNTLARLQPKKAPGGKPQPVVVDDFEEEEEDEEDFEDFEE